MHSESQVLEGSFRLGRRVGGFPLESQVPEGESWRRGRPTRTHMLGFARPSPKSKAPSPSPAVLDLRLGLVTWSSDQLAQAKGLQVRGSESGLGVRGPSPKSKSRVRSRERRRLPGIGSRQPACPSCSCWRPFAIEWSLWTSRLRLENGDPRTRAPEFLNLGTAGGCSGTSEVRVELGNRELGLGRAAPKPTPERISPISACGAEES